MSTVSIDHSATWNNKSYNLSINQQSKLVKQIMAGLYSEIKSLKTEQKRKIKTEQ